MFPNSKPITKYRINFIPLLVINSLCGLVKRMISCSTLGLDRSDAQKWTGYFFSNLQKEVDLFSSLIVQPKKGLLVSRLP